MKPVIIGEAPGPQGDPEKPLEGQPAERLLTFMGFGTMLTRSAGPKLREMFEVRNLIDRPMERPEDAKGCEWPKKEAEEAAHRLAFLIEPAQPTVFLGKRVAAAFEFGGDYWEWQVPPAIVIPHPSGIVRLWNDPINRVRAGMTLWQALGKIPR